MRIDRHWWRTNDGRLVPDGHPEAALLAFPRGHEIPDLVAKKTGLEAAVEKFASQSDDAPDGELKQAPPPADKMAPPPADKAVGRIVSKRPPASGPGSGAEAWRKYAVDETGKPAEWFADMSRDQIVEFLDDVELN